MGEGTASVQFPVRLRRFSPVAAYEPRLVRRRTSAMIVYGRSVRTRSEVLMELYSMKPRILQPVVMCSLLAVCLASCVDSLPAAEPTQDVEAAIRALNDAFPTHDPEKIKALMAPTHLAFTPWGGKQTRDQQIETLKDLALDEYTAGPMTITMIGKEAALVTYAVTVKGRFRGKPLQPKVMASAVWVKTEGKWLELHYQETVVPGT